MCNLEQFSLIQSHVYNIYMHKLSEKAQEWPIKDFYVVLALIIRQV